MIVKRYNLLLEVLIALAIVVLCMFPLLYPHVGVIRSQQEMISAVQLDHLVSLHYGQILEKLYLKEIPWETLHSDKPIPIDKETIRALGIKETLPYKGSYHFVEIKHKPKKLEPNTPALYLFKISYEFEPIPKKPDEKSKKYDYQFVLHKNSH